LLGSRFAALLALSTALCLVIAELVVRTLLPQWSDQWKMWRLDPVWALGLKAGVDTAVVHGHSREFAFHFRTNAQGLRMDADLAPTPAPGKQRALFVGDSFTFGYGVEQDESFTARLQQRFDARGEPVEAINAGFASGFTLDTEYLFTREQGASWQPSRVIAGVCLSNDLVDLGETRWRVVNGHLEGLHKHDDWVPLFVKQSALVNLLVKSVVPELRAALLQRRLPWNPSPLGLRSTCELLANPSASRPARAFDGSAPPLEASKAARWPPRQRALWVAAAWQEHARAQGYVLALLLIPDAEEVQWDTTPERLAQRAAVREVFAEAAEAAGIQVLDPLEDMRHHYCASGEDLYFRGDGHWNAAGHRFVAEWLDEALFAAPPAHAPGG
jgi:lysophospholipase L1-like esterase